ncbi:conjugative transfer signal peptidase TraF [Maridesulfovibrio sp.]|uniref:conjugative transfer signal peptidase TraF n=1 Tax=Maridesulfovibrio sp. TaxID=2795000 RepID=UPI0029CA1BDF|nr:conjugative transfer signal peptidase TraF [Maridesulfovibrio sp.]
MKKMLLTLFFLHALGVVYLLHGLGFRVNFTDSMPHGLYQIVPGKPDRGDLITFSLAKDNPYFQISLERHYLGLNGNRPLLKTLAGLPGDSIEISAEGVCINSDLLPNTQARSRDKHGRRLPIFLNSTVIPSAKGLALSTYNENSFDGRYFGLVNMDQVRRVVPVLTFNSEDKTITKYSCPKCGSNLIHLLPTIEHNSRWICSSYPNCHYWTHAPNELPNVAEAKK